MIDFFPVLQSGGPLLLAALPFLAGCIVIRERVRRISRDVDGHGERISVLERDRVEAAEHRGRVEAKLESIHEYLCSRGNGK